MRRLVMMAVLIGMNSPVWAVDEQQVRKVIEEAQQEFDKAVALQGGWKDTAKLLKDAQLSVTKGDLKKAMDLADRAKREAELSYAEAENQNKNWSEPDYLRK
jgi:hypothetical protein